MRIDELAATKEELKNAEMVIANLKQQMNQRGETIMEIKREHDDM